MALSPPYAPSVRVAGATTRPRAVSGIAMASAWSVWPASRSSIVISPPAAASPEAVAPYGAGLTPSAFETSVIFAPHDACHPGVLSRHVESPPSSVLRACQSSHIVSVDGCELPMCRLVPPAGRGPAGHGRPARAPADRAA